MDFVRGVAAVNACAQCAAAPAVAATAGEQVQMPDYMHNKGVVLMYPRHPPSPRVQPHPHPQHNNNNNTNHNYNYSRSNNESHAATPQKRKQERKQERKRRKKRKMKKRRMRSRHRRPPPISRRYRVDANASVNGNSILVSKPGRVRRDDDGGHGHDGDDDVMIELNSDIFCLFIVDWFANGVYSTKLLVLAMLTYAVQLFALIALTLAYIDEFHALAEVRSSKLFYWASEFDVEVHEGRLPAIHFMNFLAGFLILFCYLMMSITHFSSVVVVLLNCNPVKARQRFVAAAAVADTDTGTGTSQEENGTTRNRQQSLHFYASVFIAFANIAMAVSTYIFIITLMVYAVYWKLENPSDILMSSVGAAFILEVDDWVGAWFMNDNQFVEIPVARHTHETAFLPQLKHYRRSFAVFLMTFSMAWLVHGLNMVEDGASPLAVAYYEKLLFCFYIGMLAFSFSFAMVVVHKDEARRRLWTRVILFTGAGIGYFYPLGLYLQYYDYFVEVKQVDPFLTMAMFAALGVCFAFQLFCMLFDNPTAEVPSIHPPKCEGEGGCGCGCRWSVNHALWCLSSCIIVGASVTLRITKWDYGSFGFSIFFAIILLAWKFNFVQLLTKHYENVEPETPTKTSVEIIVQKP